MSSGCRIGREVGFVASRVKHLNVVEEEEKQNRLISALRWVGVALAAAFWYSPKNM
jgi:uncharacterized membrane protein YqjE